MTQILAGTAIQIQPLASADAARQAKSKSPHHIELVERLDAYQTPVKDGCGDAGSDWGSIIPILSRQPSASSVGASRARRSADGQSRPTSTTESNPTQTVSPCVVGKAMAMVGAAGPIPGFATDPALAGLKAREPVAGVPLNENLGLDVLNTFRKSSLSTWERADVMERVFKEWNSEGPSPQAAERLQKILAPGYTDTPDECKGAVILDAFVLHLIDRGRYVSLTRNYIDTLKRSGEFDPIVDALNGEYPNKTRDWASNMVETTLRMWNEPLPVDLRMDGDSADEPAFDLEARLSKLYALMNPDSHINQKAVIARELGREFGGH